MEIWWWSGNISAPSGHMWVKVVLEVMQMGPHALMKVGTTRIICPDIAMQKVIRIIGFWLKKSSMKLF